MRYAKLIISSIMFIGLITLSIVGLILISSSNNLKEMNQFTFIVLFVSICVSILFTFIFGYITIEEYKVIRYSKWYVPDKKEVEMMYTELYKKESADWDELMRSAHNPDENPIYGGYNGIL